MKVIIDGVEYVPKSKPLKPTDERLQECLMVLTEMRYFNQRHNMMGLAWNAINVLSPDIAAMDTEDAFNLIHGEE